MLSYFCISCVIFLRILPLVIFLFTLRSTKCREKVCLRVYFWSKESFITALYFWQEFAVILVVYLDLFNRIVIRSSIAKQINLNLLTLYLTMVLTSLILLTPPISFDLMLDPLNHNHKPELPRHLFLGPLNLKHNPPGLASSSLLVSYPVILFHILHLDILYLLKILPVETVE